MLYVNFISVKKIETCRLKKKTKLPSRLTIYQSSSSVDTDVPHYPIIPLFLVPKETVRDAARVLQSPDALNLLHFLTQ